MSYEPKLLKRSEVIKLITLKLEKENTEQLTYWLNLIEPLNNRWYDRIDENYIIENKLFKNRP